MARLRSCFPNPRTFEDGVLKMVDRELAGQPHIVKIPSGGCYIAKRPGDPIGTAGHVLTEQGAFEINAYRARIAGDPRKLTVGQKLFYAAIRFGVSGGLSEDKLWEQLVGCEKEVFLRGFER